MSFDDFFFLSPSVVAVLQQQGSLGGAWKGAVAARWLRGRGELGSLPQPAPGRLLGGSFPPPRARQRAASAQHRKFCRPSAKDCVFQKIFGFRLLSFPEGRICVFTEIILFFFFLLFKGDFFNREGKLGGTLIHGQELCRMRLHPLFGFWGWLPRSPATGPHGREEVARLGSRSETQLLVLQFLPSWGWDVDEGWVAAFPPAGREMSPE